MNQQAKEDDSYEDEKALNDVLKKVDKDNADLKKK